MSKSDTRIYCFFCGKNDSEVGTMVASNRCTHPGAIICHECIIACMDSLRENNKATGGWVHVMDSKDWPRAEVLTIQK